MERKCKYITDFERPVKCTSSCQSEVISEDVALVEFMYLVFTRMQGESYRRRLRSLLLCLCDVFRALSNSQGEMRRKCILGRMVRLAAEAAEKNRWRQKPTLDTILLVTLTCTKEQMLS